MPQNMYVMINNQNHFTLELDDDEAYNKILEDHQYRILYIYNLMNEGYIEKVNIFKISISKDNINFVTTNEEELGTTSSGSEQNKENEWTEPATKLLLDKYHSYLSEVGPMKRFKLKKQMWEKISSDLLHIQNFEKNGLQCENRFKTIMKRKKKAIVVNKTTGASPVPVEYEEELDKIASLDDSVEPEIKIGVGRCDINYKKASRVREDGNESSTDEVNEERPRERPKKNKKEKKDICDILWDIHKDKEERRERRHREKLELLREIGTKLQREDNGK